MQKISEEPATYQKLLKPNDVADILIWEATNGRLLIPVVIALVILTRWIRGTDPLLSLRRATRNTPTVFPIL